MKTVSSLILATAFSVAGGAFAQTPSQSDANSMQANAPVSTMAPSAAADANQSSDAIATACEKQASDKKITGEAKTNWVKKCKMGKTTRQDH